MVDDNACILGLRNTSYMWQKCQATVQKYCTWSGYSTEILYLGTLIFTESSFLVFVGIRLHFYVM